MRDLRDNKLLRRLGYRAEATVYAGEADYPHGRHYVSAIDDDGGAVYAVRRSGVPVLLVALGSLNHYHNKGHAWPMALMALENSGVRASHRVVDGDYVSTITLPAIHKHAPALLDQASGVALFNVQDAIRLLAKYDALQAEKRAKRRAS